MKADVVDSRAIQHVSLPGRASGDPWAGLRPGASSVRHVRLAHDPRRTPHLHPHSEEVVYVVEGHGEVWVDGAFHPVGPGSWVRIPPATPHATLPAPEAPMTLACFFPHPDLRENLEELGTSIERNEEPPHE